MSLASEAIRRPTGPPMNFATNQHISKELIGHEIARICNH
jgi:hypothetical protein